MTEEQEFGSIKLMETTQASFDYSKWENLMGESRKDALRVNFDNKRGTAEQWIKEGKYALSWTRLSCHDFTDNQVRLQLFALAYNLGNFLRRLALPKKIRGWSLRTPQVKLIKIGAKVIRHSRYVIFQMAEEMVQNHCTMRYLSVSVI